MSDNGATSSALAPIPAAPVAAVPKSPPHPLDGQWFMHSSGQTYGPFTGHQLRDFATEGRIDGSTDVVRAGSETWMKAADDAALAIVFPKPAAAPGLPTPSPVSAAPGSTVVQVHNVIGAHPQLGMMVDNGPAAPKSPGLALFLSILIVGAGQMYNGQVGKGISMMLLAGVLWFVFLGWIVMIWSWVDAYQTAKRMNDRYQRRLAAGLPV